MRFLILTIWLYLTTIVYADNHNINQSGFLSKKLEIKELSKIENPKEKIILIYNHGQNTFDGSGKSCTDYGQIRNQASLVGERGPALFVPRTAGTIIPNNKIGGGPVNNITINVDGSGMDTQGSSEQSGKQLGEIIAAVVQSTIINEQRSGGLLNP